MHAAVRRLKDEYLIRIIDENTIEALHPVRAKIVFDALCDQVYIKPKDVIFKVISCISSQNVRIVLLDYFSNQLYNIEDIQHLSQIRFCDWVGYAEAIRSMLWLDAKCYVESNITFINALIAKCGKRWLFFLPFDPSGIEKSDELIADRMKDLSIFDKLDFEKAIDVVKESLTSLSISYQATDCFINNSVVPSILPDTDIERSSFGYALFWMAKRGRNVTLPFKTSEIVSSVCAGELQSSADAIRGLFEHPALQENYLAAMDVLVERIIHEMHVLTFSVTNNEVSCKFIPPLSTESGVPENEKNSKQYWRIKMLDILKQLYPEKEYIYIELIGVDLLQELGIEVLDRKLRIHKSKRPNVWVSELNGWIKIRIDYSLRPSSWLEYIADIDETRSSVNDLIVETIKLIDDVYKKRKIYKK